MRSVTTKADLGQEQEKALHPVDAYVGARVRLRRTLLGMSQAALGKALGLTFQQVQRYERGLNRIGASRLLELTRVLDVPIAFFFDDMPDGLSGAADVQARFAGALAEQADGVDGDLRQQRETLELVRAYHLIAEPAVRKRLLDLVRSLGSAE
ncbi:helix-turn-helix domain-containing protein [Muricoccus radiodurans]|uniref:helix-turn-helix domain-containing protein n=1 Tax=Muricoccus radiodurans TaxID=2231721 RepID=UPI003CF200EF